MQRPRTAASAVAYPKSIDDKGTMYAPTAIGWEARFTVAATSPIRFSVAGSEPTEISFRNEFGVFRLLLSDMALLALGKLVNGTIPRLRAHRSEERGSTSPDDNSAGPV